VVVENRAGAGTMIGGDLVAKAAPDGHTLLMGVSTLAINPSTFKTVPYDAIRDFAPITQAVFASNIMVIHPSVPARNAREFIALARARPGQINYASAGNGTTNHLLGEMFKQAAGLYMVHIPYRGAAAAATDVVGGQVPLSVQSMPSSIAFIRAGKLKVLGVVNEKRLAALPDSPTIGETVAGFGATPWYGMFAPAGTPKNILLQIQNDVAKALDAKDVQDRLATLGCEPFKGTGDQLAQIVKSDLVRWAKIVKDSGAKLD